MSTTIITRTAINDDDGSGNTGTIIDNAWKQELYDQIDDMFDSLFEFGASVIVPDRLTTGGLKLTEITPSVLASGTTQNLDAGDLSIKSAIELQAHASGSSLGGIVAPASGTCQIFWLRNTGSGTLTLVGEDTGSTAANRFRAGAANYTIPTLTSALLYYDGSRWSVCASRNT